MATPNPKVMGGSLWTNGVAGGLAKHNSITRLIEAEEEVKDGQRMEKGTPQPSQVGVGLNGTVIVDESEGVCLADGKFHWLTQSLLRQGKRAQNAHIYVPLLA